MQLLLTYLLFLFYQEHLHDFQSPVLMNMKCIAAHAMSKQDQWTFMYIYIYVFCHATEISLELTTHTSCYAIVSSPELSTHA